MDFISGAGKLLGLVASFAAIAVAFCFACAYLRTGSAHILFLWIWRRVSGKREPKDGEVIAFIDELYDRDTFRFMSGIKAESLSQVKRLKKWADSLNIPVLTIARCGRLFDLETLKIKEDKLLSRRAYGLLHGVVVGILVLGAVLLIWSITFVQTVYFSFPGDGRWFGITRERAILWEQPNAPLTLALCQSPSIPSERIAVTGFTPHQLEVVCGYLTSPDVDKKWTRDLKRQNLAAALLFFVLVITMIQPLSALMPHHHARKLAQRIRESNC